MKSHQTKNEQSVLPVFQSREETRAYYNKISKVYDFLADRSEGPVRRSGLKMLAVKPGEKILEIGFGTGHGLVDLAKAVGEAGRVYAIDLSEEMLKLSSRLLKWAGLYERVELRCGDAVNLPYDDSMMDAIFMSFTLELFAVEDIADLLKQCRRVLKPDGRIAAVGLSKEAGDGLLVKTFEWTHRHFPNFLDCRPIFVSRSLTDAGFVVKKRKLVSMWLPVEIVLADNTE